MDAFEIIMILWVGQIVLLFILVVVEVFKSPARWFKRPSKEEGKLTRKNIDKLPYIN